MKPSWLVGSVILVAFLVWKRRKLEPTLLAGGAIVAVAAFVYGLGLIHLPNLEELLIDIGEKLGPWTYLLVGGLAFLETGAFVGLIAPGETALILGGVVAGQGQIEILAMIGIVWAAAVCGDMTSFFLGRHLGRAFLVEHGPKVQITEERLHQVEAFFDRHGGKAILIGRFVGLVRAIAPFLAGSSGMPLRRFAPYDIVGAGLWGTTFVLLGYIFWQSFSTLLDYAKKGALGLGIAIVVIVGAVWLFRWQRVPENRAKARAWLDDQLDRPALRPVARVLRPIVRTSRRPARFVWDRVTPGELGLELTTLVAIAGVGFFFFVADLVAVTDKTFVVGDQDSLRTADRLYQQWLFDIVKVVTELGSFTVVLVLVLAAGAVLVWRREVAYAAVLVVGFVLTYAAVHITKSAVDRPRPARPLIEVDGSSYPSAHAAYAMAWIAAAVALSRALPNVASRFAFIVVSIVIAAVVGLTRVYLRVHYISDVMGGWGIGGAVFAVCGTVALVVAHLRNNALGRAERMPSP